MAFSMIARLKNRRINLTRIDSGEGICNCFKFKRLTPDGRIIRHHIHLSDEALAGMIQLRGQYEIEEGGNDGALHDADMP
jgi:hypothetical protein